MAPLLALFFATMLVGQDVENQTIPYVLTRPIPRSAWLLGRFIAYMIIATVLLGLSIALTFAASTSLEDLGFSGSDLQLLFHYLGVMVLALLAYGALTLFLGAATKRPVVYGVALIYGWQSLAMIVPGLVDFLTIRKYVEAVLPAVATMRDTQQGPDNVFTFDKQIYAVGAGESILTLALITAAFVVLTVVTVRAREYASAHAAGA